MLFQCYQKSKLLVIVNFIVEYGSAILTLLAIIKFRTYWVLVIPVFFMQFLLTIILLIRIHKEIEFRFYIEKPFLKKVLKIGIPLIPVYITEWLLSFIGVYMLGYFGQLNEVGSFSVLLSVAGLFLILRTTLQFFWFSTCSNLLRTDNSAKFNDIYQLIVKGYIYLIITGIIFYTFFITDIIKLFTSKEYLFLANAIMITVIGYSFLIFSSIYNGILYALARTKEILFSYTISSLSVILISYLLIPQYRILGAAIGLLIGNFILQLLLQLFSGKAQVVEKIDNLLLVLIISSLVMVFSYYLSQLKLSLLLIRIIGVSMIIFYTGFIIRLKYIPWEKTYRFLKNKLINAKIKWT